MAFAPQTRHVLLATAVLCTSGFRAFSAPPIVEPGPNGPLQEATLVVLDFRDRPIGEVIKTIGERTGKPVRSQMMPFNAQTTPFHGLAPKREPDLLSRRVTLVAERTVPFWEAVDRLAEVGKLGYRLGNAGNTGSESTVVLFEDSGESMGLAYYSGPFRVGLKGIHEYIDSVFVRGPWVRLTPAGSQIAADSSELTPAPADGGPLHAELQVLAEPGLVCRRNGLVEDLEAIDERDRSLLAPPLEVGRRSYQAFVPLTTSFSTPAVRIPMRRPDRESKSLKWLRGSIPVELAVVKPVPALVIPLDGAEGKTFRGGGAEFTVKTARTEADGRITLSISGRLEETLEPNVQSSRLLILRTHQYRIVDAGGKPTHFGSSSSGGDAQGNVLLTFEYRPNLQYGPPAEFRYYELERATWRIPFEFHDVPLP